MRIAVLGGTGGTGSVVVRQLLRGGRPVRATARGREGAARLAAAGAQTALLDLTSASPADLAAAFEGCQAVINAAAGRSLSSRQARRVDRDGVVAAITAAQKAGVQRWIQVSMMGSDNPRRIPFFLRRIAAVKREADTFLASSDLSWTVIRPPWLTTGPLTGRITVARNLEGGSISREDLAAVAIACLDQPATQRQMFDLAGGDTETAEALASVAYLD